LVSLFDENGAKKTLTGRKYFGLIRKAFYHSTSQAAASRGAQTANTAWQDKFRQLDEVLPTPNEQRTASGAPAHAYWQQRADYVIDVTLDEKNKRITGSELITYHNNSPDTLRYLWVQLDQNRYAKNSRGLLAQTAPDFNKLPYSTLTALLTLEKHQGGYRITAVRDGAGQPLPHTINGTMMRFEISRWYPRMAAYMDVTGWQNKPFLGSGEFTLDMGDFVVNITVPEDHVVAATGVLPKVPKPGCSRPITCGILPGLPRASLSGTPRVTRKAMTPSWP